MNDKPVTENLLPYATRLDRREHACIDLVVIHCTELPDLATARSYGEKIHYPDSGTGNCGHYYIEQNGRIEQWIPISRVAHHVRHFNQRSLGIELVNPGRYPHWFDSRSQMMNEPYPLAQLNSLVALLKSLSRGLPALEWISGHENLDGTRMPASDNPDLLVYRKRDPGPMFPWEELLKLIDLKWLETG